MKKKHEKWQGTPAVSKLKEEIRAITFVYRDSLTLYNLINIRAANTQVFDGFKHTFGIKKLENEKTQKYVIKCGKVVKENKH